MQIIDVNAKPADGDARDQSEATPGVIDVVTNLATAPMANYSADTVLLCKDEIEALSAFVEEINRKSGSAKKQLELYFCDVSFANVVDPKTRAKLEGLGTNYHLSDGDVDLLRIMGTQVLRESKKFRNLIPSLKKVANARPATTSFQPAD